MAEDLSGYSLNDDAVRRIAAALWAQRPAAPAAEDLDPVRAADRTVAEALSDRNACPHGVQNGAALRPAHGTPGCPLCRLAYLDAYHAAQQERPVV